MVWCVLFLSCRICCVCSASCPKCLHFISFFFFFWLRSVLCFLQTGFHLSVSKDPVHFCLLKKCTFWCSSSCFHPSWHSHNLTILANKNVPIYLIFIDSCEVYPPPWFSGICHSMLSVVTYQDRLAHWRTFAICKTNLPLEPAISCTWTQHLFEYRFSFFCICSYLHHNEFTGSVILLAGLPLSSL